MKNWFIEFLIFLIVLACLFFCRFALLFLQHVFAGAFANILLILFQQAVFLLLIKAPTNHVNT